MILLVLILLLDCRQFTCREAAQRCLSQGAPVLIEALKVGERCGSAERRRRCQWLCDRWYMVNADRVARELGELPSIDHVPAEWDFTVKEHWQRLADDVLWPVVTIDVYPGRRPALGVLSSGDWYALRNQLATYLMLRERTRARVDVANLLRAMRTNERAADGR